MIFKILKNPLETEGFSLLTILVTRKKINKVQVNKPQ
jgi:hypothetical protein